MAAFRGGCRAAAGTLTEALSRPPTPRGRRGVLPRRLIDYKSDPHERRTMTEEAHLEETPSGFQPTGDGWFVVNVRETAWFVHDAFGSGCVFEDREAAPFPELGINLGVLQPGQPACLYHE